MKNLQRRLDFLSRRARRGVSLLWIIIAFPALILFLVFAVEIGNIWLARLELEQSLEANALAAVKQWAETGGGDTLMAREVGNDFSIANPVRGVNVDLTDPILNVDFGPSLNYDNSQPNDNAICTDIENYSSFIQSGVLIFGAITEIEGPTGPPAGSVVFNSDVIPSCSTGGAVLVDATGSGNLKTANNNEWGISFRATPQTANTDLRILRIEIDLDPDPGSPTGYVFDPGSAELSDNTNPLLDYNSGVTGDPQDDVHFLPGRNVVTTFSYSAGATPGSLTSVLGINFAATDIFTGMAPGERIRFGADALRAAGSSDQLDGDEVAGTTEIRIYFATGGIPDLNPIAGRLIDDTSSTSNGQCRNNVTAQGTVLDALNQPHIVPHDSMVVDLPCPATASSGNNGQSWVELMGDGVPDYFAVRAQATIRVQSVVKTICGFDIGPWGVSAKSTAYYDCDTGDPKLIRVDVFECDPP